MFMKRIPTVMLSGQSRRENRKTTQTAISQNGLSLLWTWAPGADPPPQPARQDLSEPTWCTGPHVSAPHNVHSTQAAPRPRPRPPFPQRKTNKNPSSQDPPRKPSKTSRGLLLSPPGYSATLSSYLASQVCFWPLFSNPLPHTHREKSNGVSKITLKDQSSDMRLTI